MPTVIDSLIVRLGLDGAGFLQSSKSAREESKRNRKDIIDDMRAVEKAEAEVADKRDKSSAADAAADAAAKRLNAERRRLQAELAAAPTGPDAPQARPSAAETAQRAVGGQSVSAADIQAAGGWEAFEAAAVAATKKPPAPTPVTTGGAAVSGQTEREAVADSVEGEKAQTDEEKKRNEEEKKIARERAAREKLELESQKKRREAFHGVKTEVLGLLTAFTAGAGIEQFISRTIQSDAATGRLAHNLGMATETLGAWQGAVKATGGETSDADNALQALTKTYQDLQLHGITPAVRYLLAFGISMKDLKDPSETLIKIADAGSKMNPAQFQALAAGLNIPPATVNLLERGGKAVRAMLEEQKRRGVVTQADADADMRLQNTIQGVIAASSRLGRTLLTEAAPALEAFGRWLTKVGEWAQKHGETVKAAFLGMAVAAGVLGVALAADTLPFVALGAAIAAVAGGIGFLLDKYPGLKAAFGDLAQAGGELGSAVGDIGKAIGEAFGVKNTNLMDLWAKTFIQNIRIVADAVRVVAALLRGDLKGAMAAATTFGQDLTLQRTSGDPTKASGAPIVVPHATVTTGGGNSGATRTARMDAIRKVFLAHGYTDAQVSGMLAGMSAETAGTFSSSIKNPTSSAYGIGQLLTSRQRDFARVMGRDIRGSSETQQAEFLAWELDHTEARAGRAIRAAGSSQTALGAYVSGYMRPGPGVGVDMRNGTAALATMGGARLAAGTGAGSTDSRNQSRTTTINVAHLEVRTAATDATGIGRDIVPAMRRTASQADQGLT